MPTSDPPKSFFARIALGTAQLGMDYGVANQSGRPSEDQVQALVGAAVAQGLDWFDTAAAYGNSEAVLGRAFANLGVQERVNVSSKGSDIAADGQTLTACVTASLQRLGLARLHAWLLHDENLLGAWDRVGDEAQALHDENRVGSFGLSAYYPENALRAVEQHGLTAVQFPASPMDRRFLRNRVASRLATAGAQLQVRSVFLQGLCLMDAAQVPRHIFRGREAVQTLTGFCARHGLERDHFCLHYVLQRTAAVGARLVIGVEHQGQLMRNSALLAGPGVDPACLDEWDALWPDDLDDLILPFRWNVRR
jgi:aryl-alcohol dehydrogenase-like predicted oxidoreductase